PREIVAPKPEAPPDLEKLRSAFTSGVDALRRGDGAAAVKHLGSFTFGSRAVEEYRLWYLANAHQLDADRNAARRTLAGLWERTEGAVSLMRDGDPQHAYEELTALDASGVPADLRAPVQLNRGLALNQLGRYEESNGLLEPLAARSYRVAIPAIYTASKNYGVLSASINPIVNKTIIVKEQVGTVHVNVKGKKKPVVRPKFKNVKKTIQIVDLAKKAKKEEDERLSIERLKDLLSLPLADEVRIEVLN